jgi:hypothetical protein
VLSEFVRPASVFRVQLQKIGQPGRVRLDKVTEVECDHSSEEQQRTKY